MTPAPPNNPVASNIRLVGSGVGLIEVVPGCPVTLPAVQPPPIVLVSSVTAAFSAIALPQPIVALLSNVILVSAIMLPSKATELKMVAELPTVQ